MRPPAPAPGTPDSRPARRARLPRFPSVLALAGCAVAAACAQPEADPPVELRPPVPLGLDLYVPVPDDNRLTAARVALGERLFHDPVLSADGRLTCAGCHRPELAFSDGLPRAVGVDGRVGARNTPSLLNAAWAPFLSWDGRARSLEEQVLLPIENPLELALPLDSAVARLRADVGYRAAFGQAFEDDVAPHTLARALASYLRTLRSGDAPADRFRSGDTAALAADARTGRRLFLGSAGCGRCHGGPLLSDGRFHNTGVGWGGPDVGRMGVTGRALDRGAFRTPSLRNVARTAPYMHDGSLATLDDVVAFYDRGGNANPNLDVLMRPLGLSAADRRALVAFLEALTHDAAPRSTPPRR